MLYLLLSFAAASASLIVYRRLTTNDRNQRIASGTHVIISGGSKGIGKSLAKKYASLGAHVTIIARNQADLQAAKLEIEKSRKNKDVQKIRAVSLDLTKISFPDNLFSDITQSQQDLIDNILGEHERCDILINSCGSSIPGRFGDLSQNQFEFMMQVNYMSAVNLTRLLLPIMQARSVACKAASRSYNGRIVFVSSMCGLMSFYGYSAYSASKFALVGLAEALHMELKPFDIGVTVAFPADTDTPGFEEENKIKPAITAEMSKTSSVFNPDDVADAIVSDVRAKRFTSALGLENQLVVMTANAFMPTDSIPRLLFECILAGPLKLVAYFVLKSWQKIVQKSAHVEIVKTQLAMNNSKDSKFYEKFCGNRSS